MLAQTRTRHPGKRVSGVKVSTEQVYKVSLGERQSPPSCMRCCLLQELSFFGLRSEVVLSLRAGLTSLWGLSAEVWESSTRKPVNTDGVPDSKMAQGPPQPCQLVSSAKRLCCLVTLRCCPPLQACLQDSLGTSPLGLRPAPPVRSLATVQRFCIFLFSPSPSSGSSKPSLVTVTKVFPLNFFKY